MRLHPFSVSLPLRLLLLLLSTAFIPAPACRAADQPQAPSPSPVSLLQPSRQVRVLALGDSITQGKNEGNGGYRRRLYEMLLAAGYPTICVGSQETGNGKEPGCSDGTIPRHEGYGSFRIDMIHHGGIAEKRTAPPITETMAVQKPDVVLLMLGTNDIMQDKDISTMPQRLQSLVDELYKANDNLVLLVASIGPITEKLKPGAEEKVVAFNSTIPAMVDSQAKAGRRIAFVDIHKVLEGKNLCRDGVHPGNKGYDVIAAAWFEALTGKPAPAPEPRKKPEAPRQP